MNVDKFQFVTPSTNGSIHTDLIAVHISIQTI